MYWGFAAGDHVVYHWIVDDPALDFAIRCHEFLAFALILWCLRWFLHRWTESERLEIRLWNFQGLQTVRQLQKGPLIRRRLPSRMSVLRIYYTTVLHLADLIVKVQLLHVDGLQRYWRPLAFILFLIYLFRLLQIDILLSGLTIWWKSGDWLLWAASGWRSLLFGRVLDRGAPFCLCEWFLMLGDLLHAWTLRPFVLHYGCFEFKFWLVNELLI